MEMSGPLKVIAFVGSIVVCVAALAGLASEWKKKELEDYVTKIMMILLTVGCIFVFLVAIGVWGRTN